MSKEKEMIKIKCEYCNTVIMKVGLTNFLGETIYVCPNDECSHIKKWEDFFGCKIRNAKIIEGDPNVE